MNNSYDQQFNINVKPPLTLGNKDYQPECVNAYKQKIGFDTGISNVLITYAGSMVARSVGGGMIAGNIGSYIGAKSIKMFILSFEKQGILILGLNSAYNFSGNNNFIPINDVNYCYKIGFQALKIELRNGSTISLNVPHWLQLPNYQSDNRKDLFNHNGRLNVYISNNSLNNKTQSLNNSKIKILIIVLLILALLVLIYVGFSMGTSSSLN